MTKRSAWVRRLGLLFSFSLLVGCGNRVAYRQIHTLITSPSIHRMDMPNFAFASLPSWPTAVLRREEAKAGVYWDLPDKLGPTVTLRDLALAQAKAAGGPKPLSISYTYPGGYYLVVEHGRFKVYPNEGGPFTQPWMAFTVGALTGLPKGGFSMEDISELTSRLKLRFQPIAP